MNGVLGTLPMIGAMMAHETLKGDTRITLFEEMSWYCLVR
jgi:hypothetical protein